MEWDFGIIGGGIAGATVGAALSRLGRVLLWEAEPACGYHASGRSAAMFEENYGPPSVVALNRASRADHEAAGHMAPRGFMCVALPGQEAQLETDIAALNLERMHTDDACAQVPILSDIAGAGWHGDAHDLDTDAMVQAGLRGISAAGGQVETDRRVDAIQRIQGGWRLTADKAEVTVRVLVNAAGAWSDDVAAMAGVAPIGLQPYRRSMARLAAPGGQDVTRWPMVMGTGERWYAKPDAGAWIVSPAEADAVAASDAWADDMVLAEGLARYQEAVSTPVTRPIASWAGLRTFAPDGTLVLGPDAGDSAFFWAAGQGGYGFQTAPAAARLVADLVAGRGPELDAAVVAQLSPERFR